MNANIDSPLSINVYNSRAISAFQSNAQSKCCAIDRKTGYLYVAIAYDYYNIVIYKSTDNGYSWTKLTTLSQQDYMSNTADYYYPAEPNEGSSLQLMNLDETDYLILTSKTWCDSDVYPSGTMLETKTMAYTFINKTNGLKQVCVPYWLGYGGGRSYMPMLGGNTATQSNINCINTVFKQDPNTELAVLELSTSTLQWTSGNYEPSYLNTADLSVNSGFMIGANIVNRIDCCQHDKDMHILANRYSQKEITYVKYDKSARTFTQQFDVDLSGYYAIDPTINRDGLGNLLCVYGRKFEQGASGVISGAWYNTGYPSLGTSGYPNNENETRIFTLPGEATNVAFHFSGIITDGPNDKIWFTNSADQQISHYYASLYYEDGSAGTPESGWWYTPWPIGAFQTSGFYVADSIIKFRFTSTATLNSGFYYMDAYHWSYETDADTKLRYTTSTNGGESWTASGTLTPPTNTTIYRDLVKNSGTYNLSVVGLQEGGFLVGSLFNSGSYTNAYVKEIPVSGTGYNFTQPWYQVNSTSGDLVGFQFFRYGDEKLMTKGNGQDIRICYQIGSGTTVYAYDDIRSEIYQERLSNTIYRNNNILTSGTTISDHIDYYASGLIGGFTDKFSTAFSNYGMNAQVLKYTPKVTSLGVGKSTYNTPIEYNVKVMTDPITYQFPVIAENGTGGFDTIIERDMRKVYFPPNFYMSREHQFNAGGILRRNIWTIFYMGNEYEITQIVPRIIDGQICHYEANLFVIGPSNDPFTKLTLPSET